MFGMLTSFFSMTDSFTDMSGWYELLETPPCIYDSDVDFLLPRPSTPSELLMPVLLDESLFYGTDLTNSAAANTIQRKIAEMESPCEFIEGVKFYLNSSKTGGFNEIESRCIQMSNIHPDTTREELEEQIKPYGEIERLEIDSNKGIASVDFYDLRDARVFRESHLRLHGHLVITKFGTPKPVVNHKKPPNNGTIVIFQMKDDITDEQLAKIFGEFGEIRQIRPTPSKNNQKFIEFWNTKCAAAAVKAMKNRKRKHVLGSKVAVEFSLPGGYRKNMQSLYETKLPTIERVHRSR